jgi:hypothetical protein
MNASVLRMVMVIASCDAGLHPQAHCVNVLEGKSLAALIHEGDAWGESRAVASEGAVLALRCPR